MEGGSGEWAWDRHPRRDVEGVDAEKELSDWVGGDRATNSDWGSEVGVMGGDGFIVSGRVCGRRGYGEGGGT